MDFGEFDEKNLFHIEDSKIYKSLGCVQVSQEVF